MGYVEEVRKLVGHRPIIFPGAVAIVMDENNRILMQRRSEKSNGEWGLPGGIMELGETLEETAIREVREETGLKIENLKFVDLYPGSKETIKAHNGDEFYVVTAAYWTSDFSGKMEIDKNESIEMKFLSIKEIPQNIVKSHERFIDKFISQNMS